MPEIAGDEKLLAAPTDRVELPAPVAQAPRPVAYLARPWPVGLILGSFLLFTLPLSIWTLIDGDIFESRNPLVFLYVWLLGATHFVLTLTVYLPSSNLRHFNSSWKNRLLYFAIPLLILIGFDLFRYSNTALAFPMLALTVLAGIRFFDFLHFSRQSYGVLQLFKGKNRSLFAPWHHKVENYFFLSLTALLLLTFLNGGHFRPAEWSDWTWRTALGLLAFAGVCLAVIVGGYARAWWNAPDRSVLVVPTAYFAMQTVAGGLAVYNISLYLFALAVHYVEYHVLMYPRCFRCSLDPDQASDRIFAVLRSRRIIFYGTLIVLAGLFAFRTWTSMVNTKFYAEALGTSPIFILIGLFDGLFILHYFLESLIWKFSDPYYRQNLGPLYSG